MKTTIGVAAILALTSTAAFAGSFQFSVGGGTARIDFDEDCTDRLCASVSWQEQGSRERTKFRLPEVSAKTISKYIDVPKPHWNSPVDDDEDTAEPAPKASSKPSSKSSAPAGKGAPDDTGPASKGEPDETTPAARDDAAPAKQAEREPQAPSVAPSARLAPPAGRPAPRVQAPAAADSASAGEPAAAPTPKRVTANQPAPTAPTSSAEPDAAPQDTKVANLAEKSATEAAKPARRTPVGEWLVEDGEGKIRIEECGGNLCGYVSAAKNPNETDRHNPNPALRNRPVLGTPILINMEPDGKRWSGRIYNVKDGRSYTAHISLRNGDTLRVEGCAFGGMICGGQNWSRVN